MTKRTTAEEIYNLEMAIKGLQQLNDLNEANRKLILQQTLKMIKLPRSGMRQTEIDTWDAQYFEYLVFKEHLMSEKNRLQKKQSKLIKKLKKAMK